MTNETVLHRIISKILIGEVRKAYGPLAYKADNRKKKNEKGGQPESCPGNRAADCSGFCMPMKHGKPIF